MYGQSTASAALAVSDALRAVTVSTINDAAVLVCEGSPGNAFPDDCVSFQQITTQQDPATLGTRRSRNENLTIKVIFSIYRKGAGATEATVKQRAWSLLGGVETYLRRTDPTLGGVCEWCFLTSVDADSSLDPMEIAEGRLYELNATFSAFVRITG